MHHRLGFIFLGLFAAFAPSFAQEEGPDERGDWFAEVNKAGNEVYVSDCACEVNTGITLICTLGSGDIRAELNMFDSTTAKEGDPAPVDVEIDGAVTRMDAKMFQLFKDRPGGYPIFHMTPADPLLDALAKGKTLKLTSGGKTDVSALKGSGKAIAVLKQHCQGR